MPGPEYNPRCVANAAAKAMRAGEIGEGDKLPPCIYQQLGRKVCGAEFTVGERKLEPVDREYFECLMFEKYIDDIL